MILICISLSISSYVYWPLEHLLFEVQHCSNHHYISHSPHSKCVGWTRYFPGKLLIPNGSDSISRPPYFFGLCMGNISVWYIFTSIIFEHLFLINLREIFLFGTKIFYYIISIFSVACFFVLLIMSFNKHN